ncbi:hypothetical protein [Pelagibacterium sp.]|uniref:hypothetical protein n=1 Tax=Pelagibacterium sp. TaxID=1967288 RepID=UPI003A950857
MRAIFRAFAAMFAAIMSAVRWVRDETGKLVMKLVGGGMPMTPMPTIQDEVAQDRGVAPDRGYDQLRLAADLLSRGRVPHAEVLDAIGSDNVKWLSAMPASMLTLVVQASDEQLSAHMRQTRSIRGLLAYDHESIAAYEQAVEQDRAIEREREQRTRRRPVTDAFLDKLYA